MTKVSRRTFLKSTSSAIVGGAAITSLSFEENVAQSPTSHPENVSQRLISGWEYRRGSLGGPWEAWRKANDDANTWAKVELPHCFNALDAVDAELPYFQGQGWYRTRLKIDNPFPNGRTLLHFEGAGQKSEVYVHTRLLNSHVGGYDEYRVDITDEVSKFPKTEKDPGSVPVAVMCDNARDLEMIPSNLSDFNLYGGLFRYVNLKYVPAISLERVIIEPALAPKGQATVSVSSRLYNPTQLKDDIELVVQIQDPHGKSIHTKTEKVTVWEGSRTLTNFIVEKPVLWSPRSPSLYRAIVTFKSRHGDMQAIEPFGLRSFEFIKNGPFMLNGERLLIRGTQRHEDHAGVGAAMTEDQMRQEMRLIKDMGANFIRLGHHQQSRIILDLCDELGLLVWEEIPWCRGGLGGERYKEQARRMLRNMIDQHRNHPSVIIWGLGNENDWPGDFEEFDKEKIRAFMTELNGIAHTLDPSRKTAIRRCDFCKDVIDVYSPSIWAGWYHGRYTDYKTRTQDAIKSVSHFLHMEWGGDSHAGRHSEAVDQLLAQYLSLLSQPANATAAQVTNMLSGGVARPSNDGDWSETYICNLFDWHLKEQETMPELTGAAQWIFKDFSTPSRPNNPVPRVNQKGVVERDLTLKEGYFVFQSYWTDKPMVHIYGHSWPTRWGDKEECKLVKVYSNCPTVELFVNGSSVEERKRDSRQFPAAGLRWLVKFKEGVNVIKAIGKKNGVSVSDEISFTYQTAKWGKPSSLVLMSVPRDATTKLIEARLADAAAVLCVDARNFVRFDLAGDGRLIDNLGTSTAARKVQLYNGRAQIFVEHKGPVVVSVSSEALPTAFLNLA
ncbi:MAG TPA: glycoside hydrolase family 2 TIM barrel-domain containing protein [Pyrinomonadaceae bacterium]|nr:glycoside hydrolase family 2 TIM barrel-domain containing protein [Pyrinomonadaceae bacterium]